MTDIIIYVTQVVVPYIRIAYSLQKEIENYRNSNINFLALLKHDSITQQTCLEFHSCPPGKLQKRPWIHSLLGKLVPVSVLWPRAARFWYGFDRQSI